MNIQRHIIPEQSSCENGCSIQKSQDEISYEIKGVGQEMVTMYHQLMVNLQVLVESYQ